jgi:hypothetical protein
VNKDRSVTKSEVESEKPCQDDGAKNQTALEQSNKPDAMAQENCRQYLASFHEHFVVFSGVNPRAGEFENQARE